MTGGYIKLYRVLLESWLWQMPPGQRCVAMTILLKANWKDGQGFSGGELVEVARGQLMTSLESLAKDSGVSIRCVRTAIQNLEKAGFLTNRSTSRFRVLTVLNYERYQGDEDVDRQTDRQASDKPATSQRQASDNDRRREEGKKEKKERSSTFDFEAIYQLYPRKQGKAEGLTKARKLVTSQAEYDRLRRSVEQMARLWRGQTDKTYCPLFSTYINQQRWKDEEQSAPQRAAEAQAIADGRGRVL